MTAATCSSKKRVIFAGLLAAIVAGLGLTLALPLDYQNVSFQPTRLAANTLDATTTLAPVTLSKGVVLEAGATLKVVPYPRGDQPDTNDANSHDQTPPSLQLTDAKITVDLTVTESGVNRPANQQNGQLSKRPIIALVQSVDFKQLDLTDALIQLRRPGGSLQPIGQVTAKLVKPSDQENGLTFDGQLTRHGRALNFKALTTFSEDGGGTNWTATISDPNLDFAFEGRLTKRNGMRLSAETASLKTKNLKALLVWLGMGPIEGHGLSAFEATGAMSWTASGVAFDQAKFIIDGDEANGRLSFRLDPQEPGIEGTLAFSTLRLDNFLGPAEKNSQRRLLRDLWHALQAHTAKDTLPLGLKTIDVDLRLSTKSLQLAGHDLGSGAAVVICRDGTLKSDFVDMRLANGTEGRAHFEVNIEDYLPSYVLSGDFQHIDLASTTQNWMGQTIADGVANITFDLSAQGHKNEVLLKTLKGPVHISALNGASLPIDLAKLFDQTQTTPRRGWRGADGGFTALQDFNIELTSANGFLKTTSAKAGTDEIAFMASGTLKLDDFVLDLVLTKLARTDDKAADALAQDGNPLEIKGPMTQPVIRWIPEAGRG